MLGILTTCMRRSSAAYEAMSGILLLRCVATAYWTFVKAVSEKLVMERVILGRISRSSGQGKSISVHITTPKKAAIRIQMLVHAQTKTAKTNGRQRTPKMKRWGSTVWESSEQSTPCLRTEGLQLGLIVHTDFSGYDFH